ncbi:hypothetical protein [Gimesia fumaroli]|uniref:Uncharacterized protein n=1 Tax=Gimesia fumaroli TaxID=2527976 RepID=A0A518IJM7_9PLAN|nr:hypothetical protein [Gimesia fumaroli]QDV53288.1 hypothetical protein Enr17x_53620 [Gimesia fumaroli]
MEVFQTALSVNSQLVLQPRHDQPAFQQTITSLIKASWQQLQLFANPDIVMLADDSDLIHSE